MQSKSSYDCFREGSWRLWVLRDMWSEALWREVLQQIESERPAKHPQTRRFFYASGGREFYLKIYHPSGPGGTVKDFFRNSKAVRALKQGCALSELGFHVPLAVAAGEKRDFGILNRAFLLTSAVKGLPLPLYLEGFLGKRDRASLQQKRQWLDRLAIEIRRMHRLGFVHGDLVPSNIVVQAEEAQVAFFFVDNDRTRRYPAWFPQGRWRRNLVQLNRFVLPGISLQDRMRFLKTYLGKPWGRGERRFLKWLEEKTRKRRRECDHVEAGVSFRELMRWNGPFSSNFSN